ncbi:MAG TPA: insulinase family protein, partial [Chthonomonadales bacterium]|nr:insulinase family protein [Chthonomonadales bacterium]
IGISRTSPDYVAAEVMNLILGGNEFVGRVGKRVRDTEGLAYYAVTSFAPALAQGPWIFRAGANPKNVPHAISSTLSEIRSVIRGGVKPSELAWAKDNVVGSVQLGMATNAGIAEALDNSEFYGLGLDYYSRRFPMLVRSLTVEQVNQAARKYLKPQSLVISVAGPPVPGLDAISGAGRHRDKSALNR